MANPFQGFVQRRTSQYKPGASRKSSAGQAALMGYILGQQKAQEAKQELPVGSKPVSATINGVKYENPLMSGQVKESETSGQRIAETAPSRAVMKGTLVKAKRLADTVPPTPTGIGRLFKGAKNEFSGNVTQEIPQIAEFHRLVNSTLTAFARTMYAEKGNVANWDIKRVKDAFSDIAWDTSDARALGWNRFVDTYNDVIRSYKSISPDEYIDKRELLTPKEIGRARLLSGENKYDDLNDEELEGLFDGNLRIVPKNMVEKAVQEYEKRGLHQRNKVTK